MATWTSWPRRSRAWPWRSNGGGRLSYFTESRSLADRAPPILHKPGAFAASLTYHTAATNTTSSSNGSARAPARPRRRLEVALVVRVRRGDLSDAAARLALALDFDAFRGRWCRGRPARRRPTRRAGLAARRARRPPRRSRRRAPRPRPSGNPPRRRRRAVSRRWLRFCARPRDRARSSPASCVAPSRAAS